MDRLHRLLAQAVALSINNNGCDLRLGVAEEDSRLWALYDEGLCTDISIGADPIEMLETYLRAHEEKGST